MKGFSKEKTLELAKEIAKECYKTSREGMIEAEWRGKE